MNSFKSPGLIDLNEGDTLYAIDLDDEIANKESLVIIAKLVQKLLITVGFTFMVLVPLLAGPCAGANACDCTWTNSGEYCGSQAALRKIPISGENVVR